MISAKQEGNEFVVRMEQIPLTLTITYGHDGKVTVTSDKPEFIRAMTMVPGDTCHIAAAVRISGD